MCPSGRLAVFRANVCLLNNYNPSHGAGCQSQSGFCQNYEFHVRLYLFTENLSKCRIYDTYTKIYIVHHLYLDQARVQMYSQSQSLLPGSPPAIHSPFPTRTNVHKSCHETFPIYSVFIGTSSVPSPLARDVPRFSQPVGKVWWQM